MNQIYIISIVYSLIDHIIHIIVTTNSYHSFFVIYHIYRTTVQNLIHKYLLVTNTEIDNILYSILYYLSQW